MTGLTNPTKPTGPTTANSAVGPVGPVGQAPPRTSQLAAPLRQLCGHVRRDTGEASDCGRGVGCAKRGNGG